MTRKFDADAKVNALILVFQATINAMRGAIDQRQLALNLAVVRKQFEGRAGADDLAMFDMLAEAAQIDAPMAETGSPPKPAFQVVLGGLHPDNAPDAKPNAD